MKFPQVNHKQVFLIAIFAFAFPIVANARHLTDGESDRNLPQSFSAKKINAQQCNDVRETVRLLKGLDLNKSQQEKIFFILYEQTQKLYVQNKIVRNAYFGLHKLTTSEPYDGSKAEEISDSLAKARAAIALIHAQEERQIYASLSEKQRKLLSMKRAVQSEDKPKCTFKPGNRSFGIQLLHIF